MGNDDTRAAAEVVADRNGLLCGHEKTVGGRYLWRCFGLAEHGGSHCYRVVRELEHADAP